MGIRLGKVLLSQAVHAFGGASQPRRATSSGEWDQTMEIFTGGLEANDSEGKGRHSASGVTLVPQATTQESIWPGKTRWIQGGLVSARCLPAAPRRCFGDEEWDEGCAEQGGFLESQFCYLTAAPVVLSRQIGCQNLKVNICLWGWWGIQRSLLFLSAQRRHNGAWFR